MESESFLIKKDNNNCFVILSTQIKQKCRKPSCAKTEISSITQFMLFWVKFPLDIYAVWVSFSCFHQVRVEFMETEDVCSSASKKGKYRTIVNVDKDSSIAVPYVIIPMTLGITWLRWKFQHMSLSTLMEWKETECGGTSDGKSVTFSNSVSYDLVIC